MLWWTPFTGDDGLQTCGEYKCFFTNERSYRHHPMLKTVFFYGTDFKPYDVPLPRKPGEDWALFHEESPKNNPIFSHKEMMSNFNHTSTFRKHSDFPLTTQYLENLEMITNPHYLIPLNVKNRYKFRYFLNSLNMLCFLRNMNKRQCLNWIMIFSTNSVICI